MTVSVVDALEFVDVEEDHRERLLPDDGKLQSLVEALLQKLTIRETGQLVMEGEKGESALQTHSDERLRRLAPDRVLQLEERSSNSVRRL